MRGVTAATVIAVTIVLGSLFYTVHIEKVSEELSGINNRIMACLTEDDMDGAADALGQLTEYLEKKRVILAATGDHADFDRIEMSVSEMSGYISCGYRTDALSQCKVLSFLFEHLPKNYQMKLENIL